MCSHDVRNDQLENLSEVCCMLAGSLEQRVSNTGGTADWSSSILRFPHKETQTRSAACPAITSPEGLKPPVKASLSCVHGAGVLQVSPRMTRVHSAHSEVTVYSALAPALYLCFFLFLLSSRQRDSSWPCRGCRHTVGFRKK